MAKVREKALKVKAKSATRAPKTKAPAMVERRVNHDVFEIKVRQGETRRDSYGDPLPQPDAGRLSAALDELFARVETLEKANRVPRITANAYFGKLTLYWQERIEEPAPSESSTRPSPGS